MDEAAKRCRADRSLQARLAARIASAASNTKKSRAKLDQYNLRKTEEAFCNHCRDRLRKGVDDGDLLSILSQVGPAPKGAQASGKRLPEMKFRRMASELLGMGVTRPRLQELLYAATLLEVHDT